MFVGYNLPLSPAVFSQRDHKRISAIDSLVGLSWIVVRGHELANNLLCGHRLFYKQISLAFRPCVAIISRLDFIKYSLGRAQPPGRDQFLHTFSKPLEYCWGIHFNVPFEN